MGRTRLCEAQIPLRHNNIAAHPVDFRLGQLLLLSPLLLLPLCPYSKMTDCVVVFCAADAEEVKCNAS
jgi:hypothetical protein